MYKQLILAEAMRICGIETLASMEVCKAEHNAKTALEVFAARIIRGAYEGDTISKIQVYLNLIAKDSCREFNVHSINYDYFVKKSICERGYIFSIVQPDKHWYTVATGEIARENLHPSVVDLCDRRRNLVPFNWVALN